MINENVLDSEFIKNTPDNPYKTIQWWEKRRLLFTIIIITIIIMECYFFSEGVTKFGIANAIIGSIAYILTANMFYTLGWSSTILINYYQLNFLRSIENHKKIVLILGIIFSVLVTIFIYEDTLLYYQRYY